MSGVDEAARRRRSRRSRASADVEADRAPLDGVRVGIGGRDGIDRGAHAIGESNAGGSGRRLARTGASEIAWRRVFIPRSATGRMTDWRAVGYGFVVMLIAGLLATFAPVVGHVGAGLIGGFVAGYVAGGGVLSGTWHGLLAGSVSGVVVTLILAAFGGLVGLAGGPVGSLLGGAGVLVVGLFLTFLFAIDSALAGAIGGVLGD